MDVGDRSTTIDDDNGRLEGRTTARWNIFTPGTPRRSTNAQPSLAMKLVSSNAPGAYQVMLSSRAYVPMYITRLRWPKSVPYVPPDSSFEYRIAKLYEGPKRPRGVKAGT